MTQSEENNAVNVLANAWNSIPESLRSAIWAAVVAVATVLATGGFFWGTITQRLDSHDKAIAALDTLGEKVKDKGLTSEGDANALNSLESRVAARVVEKPVFEAAITEVKKQVADFKPQLAGINVEVARIAKIESSLEDMNQRYVTTDLVASKIEVAVGDLELRLTKQLNTLEKSVIALQQTMNKVAFEAELDRFSEYAILTSKPQADAEGNKFIFVSFSSIEKAELTVYRVAASDSKVISYLTGIAKSGILFRRLVPNANATSDFSQEFSNEFVSSLDFDVSFVLNEELDPTSYEKVFYGVEPTTKAIPKDIKTVGQLIRYLAQEPLWQ